MTKFPYQKGLAQAGNMKFRQFCTFGFGKYVWGTENDIFGLMRCLHLDKIMLVLWWYSARSFKPPVWEGGAVLVLIWKSY